MIVLKDILYKVTIEHVIGDTHIAIHDIHFDSRKISLNDVFVAVRGTHSDGHEFIKKATHAGALAVICEELPSDLINGITYIQVADSRIALATMASNYYGNPSDALKLIGITGTNGKTTIASLLYRLFEKSGYACGLISTVKILVNGKKYDTTLTTPDSITINKYLKEMVDAGAEFCFMEVSSHGIHQHRTHGLTFAGGIFTNLSHDHLDYHKDFAEYRDVKKKFFDELPKTAFALTNSDDKNGWVMLQNSKAKKYTYALKSMADFKAQILESRFDGQLLRINSQEIWAKLIGTFNAYNILAIYGAAIILGLNELEVLQTISNLDSVGGRFQYVIGDQNITGVVDYAHTPDALKNVLVTINEIRSGNEKLITVVGCGGDRDSGKRPIMAKIAASLSSTAIFTSDNPRSEDPEVIIKEMEAGVPGEYYKRTLSITNRKEAIKTACRMANPGDIILIAGKGHETYQEIKGERFDFDDYKIVTELLTNQNQ